MMTTKRERLTIEGRVQGVGFRPFVYRLARELGLTGFVQNTPSGVRIEIEGPGRALSAFKENLGEHKPPQAHFLKVDNMTLTAEGSDDFLIRPSGAVEEASALMLPDLAVCADCLAEMQDPTDRRYRYPFINCTNCGPRFSIISALPYDRMNTTMSAFDMCDNCCTEYHEPDNRRYHAQPIACPDCGPQLELCNGKGSTEARADEALLQAAQAVRDGKILALKGLGGFHLICDARNESTVAELRRRKARPAKPFALMYPSLDMLRIQCAVGPQEEKLLTSAAAPIVLLRKSGSAAVADNVAPANPNLGVMLPYTPLHQLLMSELGFPIVATSGNRAGEPICADTEEAIEHLAGIADMFLTHDRPISTRCDDSIVRVSGGRIIMLRRSRGFAPLPIVVNRDFPAPVLAFGSHLKNTVALALGNRVFLSPHIGDLDTPSARSASRSAADLLCNIYQVEPDNIVRDLHPNYGSTRIAEAVGGNVIPVQHHYAHALSCMAENGLSPPCLAVSWDGAGYGLDNTVWGGEFLKIQPDGFKRALHFLPFPLPGGDAAALDPKRAAVGMLYALDGEGAFTRYLGLPEEEAALMKAALNKNINCPLTSSAGRIFDAVAALTGICTESSFEGQAAMALEFVADPRPTDLYPFAITDGIIDWRPMLRAIVDDIDAGETQAVISGKFHGTLAAIITTAARLIDEKIVLLTGGCFQNMLLLNQVIAALETSGFAVHIHQQVPPNDGGLALGQVMAAAHEL